MAFLNSAASYLRSLSFVNNVKKMRSSLIEFFKEEGITCEVKDGILMFEYKEVWYDVNFIAGDDYAECCIVYECNAEEYVNLEQHDKTFLADKVNAELENHATVYAFNDSFKVTSAFYFTSKRILIDLFVKHFNELNESVGMALDIIRDKIAETAEDEKPKQIGFCVEPEEANGN